MARATTRLVAWAYALGGALRLALKSPRWGLRALRRARSLQRQSSWAGLERFVLDDFLPRHFRERTRLRLGGPSAAVYRKFAGVVQAPPAASPLIQPWGALRTPARILVVREGAMGDVLLTTPIIRKLFADRQGRAVIDVATKHPQVFRDNPAVHRTLDPRALADELRSYDVVLDLDGVYERNPACHAIDAYAFHAFGRVDFDKRLELFPNAQERERIAQVVAEIGRPYLVVHKPNHHWPNRNLPAAFWQSLMQRLLQGWPHAIVQIGGPGDAVVDGDARLLDHRARYSLQELQQLIEHSAGFIGVDAGPVHVASATNAPMFVFFTSAHHDFRKPLRAGGVFVPLAARIDCYGCQASNPPPGTAYYCRRGDNECVNRFDAFGVAELVVSALPDAHAS